MGRWLLWLSLVAVVALSAGRAAIAHEFSVEIASDLGDADAGDGVCATAGGECSLRAAVQEANALPGLDTVVLGARVHALSIADAGEDDEDEGATGDLDVVGDLVIEGASAGTSILDGNDAFRVLDVQANASLTLRDVTVRDGLVSGADGGGLRATTGSFVFAVRTVFTGNRAFAESHDPWTVGGAGGAIALVTQSTTDVPTLLLVDARISDNVASGGGGIHAFVGATIQLLDTSIENHASGGGTALASSGGSVTIERSTIADNRADAGAIVKLPDDGPNTVRNSTFSRNLGFAIVASDGPLTLENVTLYENGGRYAISGRNTLSLRNVVSANYLVLEECHAETGGEVVSYGHNVDLDHSCARQASDRTVDDPGLGPLADHGGSTRTHLPLRDGPLVDAGDADECPPFDQRRAGRPQDGDGDGDAVCDVGAVEIPEPGPVGTWAAPCALAALAALRRA